MAAAVNPVPASPVLASSGIVSSLPRKSRRDERQLPSASKLGLRPRPSRVPSGTAEVSFREPERRAPPRPASGIELQLAEPMLGPAFARFTVPMRELEIAAVFYELRSAGRTGCELRHRLAARANAQRDACATSHAGSRP